MKTRNTQNRIFGPSGCISKEGLSLYLKNELTEKEKNLFEQHVAGCLLCNEALEGYEKFAGNDKVFSGLNSIQNDLRSTYANSSAKNLKKSGNKRTLLTTISIAACISLIFTGYYFINIQNKNAKQDLSYQAPRPEEKAISEKQFIPALPEDVAKETVKEIKEEDRSEKATITEKEGAKDVPQISEQDKFKNTVPFTATGTGEIIKSDISGYYHDADGNKAEDKKDIYNGDIDDGIVLGGTLPAPGQTGALGLSLKGAEQEIAQSYDQSIADEVTPEKIVSLEEMQKTKKESGKNAKVTAIVTASRAESKSSDGPALSYYNSAQYKDAIIEFGKSVAENNNDYQAIYYLAMSYYNDGQKDTAIKYLDKILKKKSNPFYDLALWQKALILTEKNQTGEARGLLNEIVKRGGTLKNNAIQKIDELDKSE